MSDVSPDNSRITDDGALQAATFQNAGVGMLYLSLDGNILLANEKICQMLGYTAAELCGMNIEAVTHPEDLNISHRQLTGILSNKTTSYELEKRYRRKDGSVLWVHLTVSGDWAPTADRAQKAPHNGEAGLNGGNHTSKTMRGVITIVNDITALRQVQDETRRTQVENQVAEATDVAKSNFMASVSHEMRTPLNSIMGYASLLRESGLPEDCREYAANIAFGGERLLQLVEDILDLTRIELGALELVNEPFSIQDVVEQALAPYVPEASRKGIDLDWSFDRNMPQSFLSDANRISQIFSRLTDNAFKFTDSGSIQVAVAHRYISHLNTYELRASVRDTGEGISPESRRRLFHPFSRKESGKVDVREGPGMGLAICSSLCSLMGGEIWVESEPGEGSCFHFTLKVKADDDSPELVQNLVLPDDESFAMLCPLRILLAENDKVNRLMMRTFLRRLGYEPDYVSNGPETLYSLLRKSYDLMIIDLRLPQVDGLEVVRQVRNGMAGDLCRNMAIIITAAFASEEDRLHCLDAGIQSFLPKPVDQDELKAELVKVPEANRGDPMPEQPMA